MDSQKQFNTRQQATLSYKREEIAVSIRRDKRNQQIERRRKINCRPPSISDLEIQEKLFEFTNFVNIPNELVSMKDLLRSGDDTKIQQALSTIRVILIESQQSQIQRIIDIGILKDIFNFAHQNRKEKTKKLACWLLACLCSGSHEEIEQLMNQGLLKILNDCLDTQTLSVVEHTLWCLANISGDCDDYRVKIINSPIFAKLQNILQIENISIIRILCWLFGNLVKTVEKPAYSKFKRLFPGICNVFRIKDLGEEAISDIAKCVGILTLKSQQSREDLVKYHVLPEIYQLLTFRGVKEEETIVNLFRVVGNLVASQIITIVDYALNCGLIRAVLMYIHHPDKTVVKQICWLLSNLAAGTEQQSKILFQNSDLMQKLIAIFQHKQQSLKIEVGWIFCNICQVLPPQIIYSYYNSHNTIRHFISFLYHHEQKRSLQVGLQGVRNLLLMASHFSSNGVNPMLFDNYQQIVTRVYGLLNCPHQKIIDKCHEIIDEFGLQQ